MEWTLKLSLTKKKKNTSYAQLSSARCCLLVFARISSGGARRPCFPTATNGQVRAMVLAPGKEGGGDWRAGSRGWSGTVQAARLLPWPVISVIGVRFSIHYQWNQNQWCEK